VFIGSHNAVCSRAAGVPCNCRLTEGFDTADLRDAKALLAEPALN
jgi:hypothetical protein